MLAIGEFSTVVMLVFGEHANVTLLIPPDLLKQLAFLPKADRKRFSEALEVVAAPPRFPAISFVTEMAGLPGVWRLRKGDWRAAVRIESDAVVVIWVTHRRKAYR